jgi:putative ABC transport system substrate-binding protein
LLVAVGCTRRPPPATPTRVEAPVNPALAAAIVNAPRRPGKPAILLAMPDAGPFRLVRAALLKEIKRDFDVITVVVDPTLSPEGFGRHVDRLRPLCVILMDAPAVQLERAYQQGHPGATTPALVMMASSFDEEGDGLQNASGIAAQIPAVTALVNLRSVIERPVNRVGVVHRPGFRKLLERQIALAATEQFTIVAAEVPATPTSADLHTALASLRKGGVDTLWIPSDGALLAGTLGEAWRTELTALGVPVVVGTADLVGAGRFGTLAVAPDLDALGVQAAELLYGLAESDWQVDGHPVELPISTATVVNVSTVKQRFGLRDGALQRIDRAVE